MAGGEVVAEVVAGGEVAAGVVDEVAVAAEDADPDLWIIPDFATTSTP